MKSFFHWLIPVFLLSPFTQANELPLLPKPVTFLIYYSGDNNLSEFMKTSLQQVLMEGDSSQVHVAVQFDGNKPHDSLRLSITKNRPQIWQQNVEYDMGQASTLVDFVEWGKANFPSEKLVLLIFAHGRGVLNIPVNDGSVFHESKDVASLASSSDDSSGSYINEEVMVSGLKKALGKQKIDLLIYNSCLMGNLEIMNMLSSVSHFAVASEYPIYLTLKDDEDKIGRSISIQHVLKTIKKYEIFNPRKIAKEILNHFEETYKDFLFPGGDPDLLIAQTFPATLAFYDLSALSQLTKKFSDELLDFKKSAQKNAIILNRMFEENLSADYVDSLGYIDILVFYRGLARSLDPQNASEKIKSFESLHAAVVQEKVALHVDHPDQLGHLSYFFPSIKKDESYVKKFQNFYKKIQITQQWGLSHFLDFFWLNVELKSDQFWLDQLKKWSAGETVKVTSHITDENADEFFFLELDVQAIKWRNNPERIKNYVQYLKSIKRSSIHLEKHIRYVESLRP